MDVIETSYGTTYTSEDALLEFGKLQALYEGDQLKKDVNNENIGNDNNQNDGPGRKDKKDEKSTPHASFDPSRTGKATFHLFTQGGVKMEAYSEHTFHKGKFPVQFIFNAGISNLISTTYHSSIGDINMGIDGSKSYGSSFVSIGTTSKGLLTIGLSLPTGPHNSVGTTIYYLPKFFMDNLKAIGNRLLNAANNISKAVDNSLPLYSPSSDGFPMYGTE